MDEIPIPQPDQIPQPEIAIRPEVTGDSELVVRLRKRQAAVRDEIASVAVPAVIDVAAAERTSAKDILAEISSARVVNDDPQLYKVLPYGFPSAAEIRTRRIGR